jgi:hypothetical protein
MALGRKFNAILRRNHDGIAVKSAQELEQMTEGNCLVGEAGWIG